LAVMTAREKDVLGNAMNLPPEAIADLLQRCDAYRKPQRFIDLLQAMECIDTVQEQAAPDRIAYLEARLSAALQVAAGEIAADIAARYPGQPQRIAQAVRQARIDAIAISS